MLPWGHAALGYLFYTIFTRVRYRHPPVGLTVYALGLGTQFSDLVDKPLAWHLAVLPSGRSLGHSALTLGLVVGVLWYVFTSPEHRRLTVAFGVGWVAHLVGDGISPLLRGHWARLGYVLWPLTSFPDEQSNLSILSFFLHLELTPRLWTSVGLATLVFCIWLIDGAPGVADTVVDYRRGETEENRA